VQEATSTKYSRVALIVFLTIAAPLYAQAPGAREVSATGGLARITGEAIPVSSGWGGASFAVRIGRGHIKFDYEHFRRFFSNDHAGIDGPDQREQFHLIGAGWLIEWEPRGFRPFFQVGGIFGIQTSSFDSLYAARFPGLAGR